MAKKKSLKAKLAKKAKAAAESPSRNTSSPAEPAPSTSRGNAEPARKEKKLLGPSVSNIKRPLLRRDPAVSKKAKKYIKDPRLIPRIMEHLDSNKNKNFVSIPLIAEELQKKYPEYARKKKSAFMQYVDRAYCIIADPGESDESDFDSDDDSNEEGFFPPDDAKKAAATEKERKRKIKEALNKAMDGGKYELTVPDVDDMPDDETLVPYQDTNSLNNMMSNMYRMNNKRTEEEPPAKQQCIEEKPDKFVEKIMYPSPDVLKKLGKKESTASLQHGSPAKTVYAKQTTDTYFIDKTGTSTSSSTYTTTTVTNAMSGNKDSRETNIQKFLGNLPSRVAIKPAPLAPPPPPVAPPPLVALPPVAPPPAQAPPLSAKERRRRDPFYQMAKRDGFVMPTPLSPNSERKLGEAYQARQKAAQEQYEAQQAAARAEYKAKEAIGFRDTSSRSRRPRSHGNVDNQTERSKGHEIQKSAVKFADVGGNEAALKEICQLLVHLRHPEVYRQLGVTPPRGFLLHGPPGCGKTLLANAIAGELELPYIKIAATEIVSGVSGNSEEKIRDLFDKALASAPCVVFIDEIDSITPKRETASKDMERRIVSQLLTCLDDLNSQTAQVLVIGATNRPDSLDPALRRAGRFDREISLGIPDENARMKILEVLCRDLRLTSEFDFKFLAHNTPGFVGADLMALTREAAMTAVNRVFHELQGPSACAASGSSSQSNELKRSDIAQSDQTGSHKQSEKSNVPGNKTVTQSNGNMDDSAENLFTWSQEQHRKENSLIKNGVTQSNGINSTSPDSGDNKTHDDDTVAKNGVTNNTKKNVLNQSAETNNTPLGNKSGKSSSKKLKYDGGREIVNGRVVRQEDNDEVVCDSNKKDVTEKSNSSTAGTGQTELHSVLSWLKEQPPLTEDQLRNLYISIDDFKEALKHVQPSAKREGFATIPDVTWDDIGALHEVREELQLAILAPVRHAEEFKRLGLNRAQGILLAGPPGCGKTLLAKAVANESGINFISVKGPELLNMYVGESEKAVRTVFQRARNSAPCVIFFDELDALCPRRSDSGEGGSSVRVVNQLLTEMDGLEERKQVFIMAATNRPDIIDPAVLRPGRLDKTLYVGLPTTEDRLDILRCITKNGTRPQLDSDTQLDDIAGDQRCEGYTGADIAALVREASIAALKQAITQGTSHDLICVNKQHYQTAFTKVKPSVSAKDHEKYRSIKTYIAV